MKEKFVFKGILLLALAAFLQCESPGEQAVEDELTGRSVTYLLGAASSSNVNGTVVFSERKDGSSQVDIKLDNLTSTQQHPVHLHLGDVSVDGAYIAALLEPVSGETGESKTLLTRLADETSVKFDDLIEMDACIKIHLAAFGEGQNIVLAAGNIGRAVSKGDIAGRYGIGVCSSRAYTP